MSNVLHAKFFNEFIDMVDLCCALGWNERNGGNMSYRISDEDVAAINSDFSYEKPWTAIGVSVPNLANEFAAPEGGFMGDPNGYVTDGFPC